MMTKPMTSMADHEGMSTVMTRHGRRLGSAVLAVLAIGGAATAVSTPIAGAEAILFGSSTGSVEGQTPWLLDEALDQLRYCQHQWGYPDRGPCYTNGFWDRGTLGDYSAVYYGPEEAAPGAEVVFTAVVVAEDHAFSVPNSEEDVDVTTVTYLPPKGFEFVGVRVTGHTPSETPSLPPEPDLERSVSVDPGSGEITVTAPNGGWVLQPGRNGDKFEGGSVALRFTLRAPDQRVSGSSSGFEFTGTSVPSSDGWVASGTTRVWPDAEGTGSAGS